MIKEDKDRLFKLLDLFSTIKDSGDCLLSNYRKIMKDDTLLPNYEKVLESDYINTKNNIVNSIVNTICNSIVLNDELLKGDVISKHLTENILSIDKNDLLNKSKALIELLSDDVKTDLLLHYESNVELLSKIPRLLNTGNYVSNIIDNDLLNSITLFNSKLDFINKCLTNMDSEDIDKTYLVLPVENITVFNCEISLPSDYGTAVDIKEALLTNIESIVSAYNSIYFKTVVDCSKIEITGDNIERLMRISTNLLEKYNLGIITQEVYNNEKDKLKVIIGYISNVMHNYNNIVAYHLKCLEFYYNTIKDLDYTIGTTVEKINNLEKENN